MSNTQQEEKIIKKSLRHKIFRIIALLMAVTIIFFAIVGVYLFRRFENLMEQTNREQNSVIVDTLTESLYNAAAESYQKHVTLQATLLDEQFQTMQDEMEVLARQVEMVLELPEAYTPQPVLPPTEVTDGELSLQLLYSQDADQSDPELTDQIQRIGGLRNMILEIVSRNDTLVDCMVSLPGGASIIADRTPASKIGENGEPLPYNADRRPWYVGAQVHKKTYFSTANRDNYLGINEVMIGVPIYVDGELAAVCGASMRIDEMGSLINKSQFSNLNETCLINESGNVLYSTRSFGELGMDTYRYKSLKESSNADLISLVNTALEGGTGFSLLNIGDDPTYIAYAPMETVGWTLLLSIKQDDLNRSAYLLTNKTTAVSEESIETLKQTINYIVLMLGLVVIILITASIIASMLFSKRLVSPIKRMTERASGIEGTDMVFEMEDAYHTGDEIEVLALEFSRMSTKLQDYVREIVQITAEKQRLDTELSVASEIQSNMLPSRFPAFPEKPEFDLYAVMDPAKEVGGDFYDYFLLDKNHLALVMADVSGKGIPAALYMVVSKTVIKNAALSDVYDGPGGILKYVNDVLCDGNEDCMFVTAWLGILTLSTGELVSACAGHEYPVFWRKDSGFVMERDKHGLSLGAMEGVLYKETTYQMNPGDLLFLYTDGLPEATNANQELFGNERMLEALTDSWDGEDLEELLRKVRERVDEYVGEAPQFDDLTMMCIRYNGT